MGSRTNTGLGWGVGAGRSFLPRPCPWVLGVISPPLGSLWEEEPQRRMIIKWLLNRRVSRRGFSFLGSASAQGH